MPDWRFTLPFLFIAAFLIFEDLITVPSCVLSDGVGAAGPTKLKAVIVSDLLLKGSDASYTDAMFRNVFFSRFFRKSYEKLEPDMLVILGDISAKKSEVGKIGWLAVLQQLYRVIGPFVGVPLIVGLGERDVGECSELDDEFVAKIANNLPGLDRTGSASFRFENVSFFMINDVALLCNENALRFGVEKLIESESFDLRAQLKDSLLEADVPDEINKNSDSFPSLKSYPSSGSGPVLLLHFPLSRAAENSFERNNILSENLQRYERKGTDLADSDTVETVHSQLMQTLPLNETEYILQSLRPRIVFSAHRQRFNVYNHSDGTREVTVPAMTWASSGKPGFVFATFGETNTTDPIRAHLNTRTAGRRRNNQESTHSRPAQDYDPVLSPESSLFVLKSNKQVAHQDILKVLDPSKICTSVQNFVDIYLRLPGTPSNGHLTESECIRVRICEGRFALLIREPIIE